MQELTASCHTLPREPAKLMHEKTCVITIFERNWNLEIHVMFEHCFEFKNT